MSQKVKRKPKKETGKLRKLPAQVKKDKLKTIKNKHQIKLAKTVEKKIIKENDELEDFLKKTRKIIFDSQLEKEDYFEIREMLKELLKRSNEIIHKANRFLEKGNYLTQKLKEEVYAAKKRIKEINEKLLPELKEKGLIKDVEIEEENLFRETKIKFERDENWKKKNKKK